jgi:polyphosphate kinase
MEPLSMPAEVSAFYVNDRDQSWLSFNRRVLEETAFTDLGVYDKVRFVAIHGSNLDEFSRVRLAALEQMVAHTEGEERVQYVRALAAARNEVFRQSMAARQVIEETIIPELAAQGVILYQDPDALHPDHREEVIHIFMSKVLSYLQPVIITPKTEIFLEDRMLYFLLHVNAGRRLEDLKITLNIPSQSLPRFFTLSSRDNNHYVIFLDDVIRIGIPLLFPAFQFKGMYTFKVNRDADLHLKESIREEEDLVEILHRGLDVRRTGEPSLFQYDATMPKVLVDFCRTRFGLEEGEMQPVGHYLGTIDLFRLPNPVGASLLQEPWPALRHPELPMYGDYFEAISRRDYLLHFPYQAYDYVLVFFNLAVLDQQVTEIMATFYRVAQDSHIVHALISAARNGKKVKAFVEIKARFDEANNLYWAEQMAKAGVEITYSIPGIKVHAKAALIKRRENGQEKRYAYLGTGNFNEKTAAIYSDMGLLTSRPELCGELESVFAFLYERRQPTPFRHLLVSQFGSLETFMDLIDRERYHALAGKPCGITVKINNLEDDEIIERLYEAAQAGVPVTLLVRSICRIKPGVKRLSENIRLYRVVGRYLEHSRIFLFHNEGQDDLFLGSADWMKRNLRSRVEVVFPIYDPGIKKEILQFLDIQCTPSVKTQCLDENLQAIPWSEPPGQYCAQEAFYRFLEHKNR